MKVCEELPIAFWATPSEERLSVTFFTLSAFLTFDDSRVGRLRPLHVQLRTDGWEEALAAPPLDFVGFGVAPKSEAVVALDNHLIGNNVLGESGKRRSFAYLCV